MESPRRQEGGGGSVSSENPRRGGRFSWRGEGRGGCLRRIGEFARGGGGLNIFFRGRNVRQDYVGFGKKYLNQRGT